MEGGKAADGRYFMREEKREKEIRQLKKRKNIKERKFINAPPKA